MPFSEAYVTFLIHFHGDRDYFECHEVLEEHWKNNGMARDSIWVGLIQTAVSFYHYRRGNIKGSLKLIDKAIHLLSYKEVEVSMLGINYEQLIEQLHISKARMHHEMPYVPINLPIHSQSLIAFCKEHCAVKGLEWGNLVDKAPEHIVHKHILRERPEVISKRQYSLV